MNARLYKHYLLAVLMVILAFNYVDRLALGLVLQDVKLEFQASDTQLGFLSGMAFAIFYSVMGIPIARWADRGNRVTIISLSAAFWSVAVALCGAVGNFAQLLLARVGVAVGEAGFMPPANSLIPDYFERGERPRAVATYMLGKVLYRLRDVVLRMLPYWHDAIVPDLRAGRRVLVVAHGNSLRALVKHLEGISDEDIPGLDIPTGIPRLYELDDDLAPRRAVYLGDPAAAQAAAQAVAGQAS